MTEWIEHDGKGMPVDGKTKVYVKFAQGDTDEHNRYPQTALFWQTGIDSWGSSALHRIVAYRVVSDA